MVHVAIVGAYGSAGVAVADELLAREPGTELTLIDDGEPGGGLCILEGCMPSKEVLSAGAGRFLARTDDRLGEAPSVDPEAVVARKDDHIAGFADHRRSHVHGLTRREGVEFVHGRAAFVDDRRLAVGDRTIAPDYVVLATGSTVNVPDLAGIETVPYSTSADVLDATTFPDSAVVMGFGYVGLELVPYLAEVGGVDLTVIEHDDRPVDELPRPYGETLLELYRGEFGVEILTESRERRLERTDDGVRLIAERNGERLVREAEALYLFTGRRPNLDGVGLEHTRIDADGEWVEPTMRARDDGRVFVVGDANGHEPILHVAKEQGAAAGANVLRDARRESLEPYEFVPHHVIFSGLAVYPTVRIGHTPATAREAGVDAIVVERAASDDGVFATKGHSEGVATLVVDADDGTVLGYQGLHLHADVMAKTMQVAIELGLDVRELPDRAYHPTTPEILDGLFRAAADELEGR